MSYNITGTTITLTRGDTFEALVSATKRDGTQYIPVAGDTIRSVIFSLVTPSRLFQKIIRL